MTLRKNTKFSFDQAYIGRKLHGEAADDLSADDVLAFMAQSEAERRYNMARRGFLREPQTPSDDIKSYLMKLDT
jgi:hypothetical protein